jgi:cardiolipin hydrolase
MHHKFAVIDEAVVLTGSFNWTTQAVKFNQENVLFLENNGIAKLFTDNFNKMWNEFKTIIEEDEAIKKIQDERKNKKQYYK